MTCTECNRDVPAFQCAHWTCSCGASIATCFTCNYGAYAVVDGFRRDHCHFKPLIISETTKECRRILSGGAE